jgi:hypothetical protein
MAYVVPGEVIPVVLEFPSGVSGEAVVTHGLGRDANAVEVSRLDSDGWRVIQSAVVTHAVDKMSFTISANIPVAARVRYQ